MYRLILAMLLLAGMPAGAAAADELAYGSTHSFAAVRNGEQIGRHSLTFRRDGRQLMVSTSIELTVKFLGFTAYRYVHQAQEVWSGDVFQSLASETEDNGKKLSVRIRRAASHFEVERNVRAESLRALLPLHLMPSSHWNVRQVRQTALVNTQDGTEARIQVSILGRETIATRNARIDATRYRYTGDIRMDQWFDDSGRWVKMSFAASDGSTVEYVQQ